MLPPIRLIHGDCHAVLPELIREGIIVDTVIADIPYNLHRAAWDSGFSLAPLAPILHQLLKPGGNLVIFSGWRRTRSS